MDKIKCGVLTLEATEVETDYISETIDISEFENPIVNLTVRKKELDNITLFVYVKHSDDANTAEVILATFDGSEIIDGTYYVNYVILEACE